MEIMVLKGGNMMLPMLLLSINNEDDRLFIADLYEQFYPIMKKKALSIIHDTSIVEDLINDAFIKFIDKIEILKTLDSCKRASYIVITIRNISINYIKKRNNEKNKMHLSGYDNFIETLPDIACTLEEDYTTKETYQALGEAIRQLSERDRNLLFYKYYLELTDKEIAKLMNIPVNNIREYLVRARRRALKSIAGRVQYEK